MDRLLVAAASRARSRQLAELALGDRFAPGQILRSAGWRVARAHSLNELGALLTFSKGPFHAALVEALPDASLPAVIATIQSQIGPIPILALCEASPAPHVRCLPQPLPVDTLAAELRALRARPRVHLRDSCDARLHSTLTQIDPWQLSVSLLDLSAPLPGTGTAVFWQPPPASLQLSVGLQLACCQSWETAPAGALLLPDDPRDWVRILEARHPTPTRPLPRKSTTPLLPTRSRRNRCKLGLRFQDERSGGEAETLDLSTGGLAASVEAPPAVGTTLEITLALPQRPEVQATAEVVWRQDGAMGLRYLTIDPCALQRLLSFSRDLSLRQLEPAS